MPCQPLNETLIYIFCLCVCLALFTRTQLLHSLLATTCFFNSHFLRSTTIPSPIKVHFRHSIRIRLRLTNASTKRVIVDMQSFADSSRYRNTLFTDDCNSHVDHSRILFLPKIPFTNANRESTITVCSILGPYDYCFNCVADGIIL